MKLNQGSSLLAVFTRIGTVSCPSRIIQLNIKYLYLVVYSALYEGTRYLKFYFQCVYVYDSIYVDADQPMYVVSMESFPA